MIASFMDWYKKSYRSQLRITAVIFSLQIIHLMWLTRDVVFTRIFSIDPVIYNYITNLLIVFVDYLEIPTLISVSLIYINSFLREKKWRDLIYLALLNSQWLHIFWITDEFVADIFVNSLSRTSLSLAWIAILIDYLELPVIYETLRRAFKI